MAVGSLVDVVMPQMGVSVSEGTISRWAKQVGDQIEADETIVEISTDKVDTEVPSPALPARSSSCSCPEGETVPVTTVIARIDTAGGAPLAPVEPVDPPPPRPPRRAEPSAGRGRAGAAAPSPRRRPRRRRASRRRTSGPPPPTGGYRAGDLPRPAPGALRSAEHGEADDDSTCARSCRRSSRGWSPSTGSTSAQIPGTGRGGRVTKHDVEVFLQAGAPARRRPRRPPPAALHPPRRRTAPCSRRRRLRPGRRRAGRPGAAGSGTRGRSRRPPPPPGSPRALATRSTASPRSAGHREAHDGVGPDDAHSSRRSIEVDMTARGRPTARELKPHFEARYGVNLTFLPFIMKATSTRSALAVDERRDPRRRGAHQALRQPRHGRRRRRCQGPARAGHQERRDAQPGRAGPAAHRPRRPRPQEAADERRDDRRDVHDHEPRRLRRDHGHADPAGRHDGIIDIEAIVKRPVVVTDEHGNDSIAHPLDDVPADDLRPPTRRRRLRQRSSCAT